MSGVPVWRWIEDQWHVPDFSLGVRGGNNPRSTEGRWYPEAEAAALEAVAEAARVADEAGQVRDDFSVRLALRALDSARRAS